MSASEISDCSEVAVLMSANDMSEASASVLMSAREASESEIAASSFTIWVTIKYEANFSLHLLNFSSNPVEWKVHVKPKGGLENIITSISRKEAINYHAYLRAKIRVIFHCKYIAIFCADIEKYVKSISMRKTTDKSVKRWLMGTIE